MRRWIIAGIVLAVTAGWILPWAPAPAGGPAFAQPAFGDEPEDADALRVAAAVVREISAIPEKGMPPALMKNAYALAVIPNVIKAGLVLGGRYGKGVLLERDGSGAWKAPVEISITSGSLGWQIGVQSTDVILVFKTPRSVQGLASGKVTLGADASVAAGPVGRHAEAATDVQLKAEVYSYSRNRGLFAGVSFEGSGLQTGKTLKAPKAARELHEAIEKASAARR